RPLQNQPNAAFECPSDPRAPGSMYTNYVACAGGGSPTACPCVSTSYAGFIIYTNGAFYINSHTRVTDIKDGSSNTYLMGETKYQVADLWSGGVEKRGLWSGGAYLQQSWRYYVNMGAAVEGINQPASGTDYFTGMELRQSEEFTGRTFGSLHRGGANMLFAD